jgi:hypothetical protein
VIADHHLAMLAASGITDEHAMARGYETITDKRRLANLDGNGHGITPAGRNIPGLLVPLLRVEGSTWGCQYRPDIPRCRDGKPIKYETPYLQRNGLDIPPGVAAMLGDPSVPLWITEGIKKADAGAIHGLCIVALCGVWNWLGTNSAGGRMALHEWRDVPLNNNRRVIIGFDGDVARKESVQKSVRGLAGYLATKGARVEYLHLPDTDEKTGLDDYLAEHTVEELRRLVKPVQPVPKPIDITGEHRPPPDPKPQPAQPVPLDDALGVFSKWLHIDDTAPIIATAATVVTNLAEGDPVWLLIVGPPSCGKTEILSSLLDLPCIVPAATITEASLLSGTSQRDRAKDATGGLMRQIGDLGILLCKDFTSVLSQNYDVAKRATGALREIYDGRWDRPVGVDGARVLHWKGKCGFIAGVTPSYDKYSVIVNALGDRYMLLRIPPIDPDKQARAARAQVKHGKQMRAELAAAMTGLIAGADWSRVHELDDESGTRLERLAIYTARARTGVERNGYTKDLEVIPEPEGPARLVKAMCQLYDALVALGVDTETRWDILTRIAIDCTPAIRMPLIRVLTDEDQRTTDIAERVGMITKTATIHLDDLALIGMADRRKESAATNSSHLWRASDWLQKHWPQKVRTISTTTHKDTYKEAASSSNNDSDATDVPVGGGRNRSYLDGDASRPTANPNRPKPKPSRPSSRFWVAR